jgi:hypothetical protein
LLKVQRCGATDAGGAAGYQYGLWHVTVLLIT